MTRVVTARQREQRWQKRVGARENYNRFAYLLSFIVHLLDLRRKTTASKSSTFPPSQPLLPHHSPRQADSILFFRLLDSDDQLHPRQREQIKDLPAPTASFSTPFSLTVYPLHSVFSTVFMVTDISLSFF